MLTISQMVFQHYMSQKNTRVWVVSGLWVSGLEPLAFPRPSRLFPLITPAFCVNLLAVALTPQWPHPWLCTLSFFCPGHFSWCRLFSCCAVTTCHWERPIWILNVRKGALWYIRRAQDLSRTRDMEIPQQIVNEEIPTTYVTPLAW